MRTDAINILDSQNSGISASAMKNLINYTANQIDVNELWQLIISRADMNAKGKKQMLAYGQRIKEAAISDKYFNLNELVETAPVELDEYIQKHNLDLENIIKQIVVHINLLRAKSYPLNSAESANKKIDNFISSIFGHSTDELTV